jgi:predicted Zn-dependent protease with MMP-like domain
MKRPATLPNVAQAQIEAYVLANCDDHRDELGDINITTLGEDVSDHFGFEAAQYDYLDVDFTIWRFLRGKGMLPDD